MILQLNKITSHWCALNFENHCIAFGSMGSSCFSNMGTSQQLRIETNKHLYPGCLKENKVTWDPNFEPPTPTPHAAISPRSLDITTGNKEAIQMSVTLCRHGGQEAPCSQPASVCAEIMTTESAQGETNKGPRSAFISFLPTPALPWHLCISASLIQGEGFQKHRPHCLCGIISQQCP